MTRRGLAPLLLLLAALLATSCGVGPAPHSRAAIPEATPGSPPGKSPGSPPEKTPGSPPEKPPPELLEIRKRERAMAGRAIALQRLCDEAVQGGPSAVARLLRLEPAREDAPSLGEAHGIFRTRRSRGDEPLGIALASWQGVESLKMGILDDVPSSPALLVRWTLVGRDGSGGRCAARGTGRVPRDPADATGASFVARELVTATRDVMTDVTAAAGLERKDPSLMERGGRGLLSHGAAAADVDGDGLVDLFVAGLGTHALYRNRGDGTFEDVAAATRVATSASPATAPLFLDADGDGDQDLFLAGLGHQSLFENLLVPEGRLVFRDVSGPAGMHVERAAFSAAAGDVNGDGLPDIAVACYGDYGNVVPDSWIAASNGQPNLLFLNEGGLRFRERAAELGCADARWSYATLLADLDDDADLDLLVANDFGGAVGAFVNEGGRFEDRAAALGLGAPSYGMGLSLGDPDRDGDLDLHVTKASSPVPARVLPMLPSLPDRERSIIETLAAGNALHERLPGGTFGPALEMPTGWSWGGGFVDLDLDGFADLVVPGGFLSGAGDEDTDDLFWRQAIESLVPGGQSPAEFFGEQVPAILERGASFAGRERDAVFLNDRRGGWIDVSGATGLDSESDGRAALFADLDDDGDPDVFLRAMHDRAHLLWRNEAEQGRFVRVALRGTSGGADACGAIVRARVTPDGSVTAQAKLCGSGFLAQPDPRLIFGLGDADGLHSLEVAWPSGARETFPGARAGSSVLLVEGSGASVTVRERAFRLGGR